MADPSCDGFGPRIVAHLSFRQCCRKLGIGALALWAMLGTATVSQALELPACEEDQVHVLGTTAGIITYKVEIADEPEEQARGLMFRSSLESDAGMLFIFDPPRAASFWMRNTMIPLDMIFIDDRGRVTNVAERTIPYSEFTQRSEGPVRAVLEVNAGEAARLGIGPGTVVRHPAFSAAEGAGHCEN